MNVLRQPGGADPGDSAFSTALAARVGGYLFLAGAALTGLATVLPLPDGVDRTGFRFVCIAQILLALLMFRSGHLQEATAQRLRAVVTFGSILTISALIVLSGADTDGAAVVSVFYVLPGLFAGYFFGRLGMILTIVTTVAAYCTASALIGAEFSAVVIRGLVILSVFTGVTAAVHVVRLHVDELVQRLDRLARVDALTALLNRRGYDEGLRDELARYARTGRPLSLAIGDVDHFKLINDRFGHACGDDVLREVGAALQTSVRTVDTVARIGGEEFAVLMPDTEAEAAVDVVARIRAEIAAVKDPAGQPVEITFGVVSTDDPDCQNAASLMIAADRALYEGKARGRNDTVLYSQSSRSTALHAAASAADRGSDAEISPAVRA